MLHNKKIEVLEQFLGDFRREAYGRELLGKVRMSQKAIALALDSLEKEGVLKSRTQGHIRYFSLNLENTEIKDIILLAETSKKLGFLSKHRKLAHLFREDDRTVGVFGSYAKGTEKDGSDIDVFIVGRKKEEDYDKKGKLLDLDVSVKYFSEAGWRGLLRRKDNLCREIVEKHILLYGTETFISTVWKCYYGLGEVVPRTKGRA